MIFVSSSCLALHNIGESVTALARAGYREIELSGGTEYYPGLETELLELKNKYDLSYLCHNYFPPPQDHFVLNLASPDTEIYRRSLEHLLGAITLSQRLGADRFAFHSGFYLDIPPEQLGQAVAGAVLCDSMPAQERFCRAVEALQAAANGFPLYLENNVLSAENARTFAGTNPFMLTCSDEWFALRARTTCRLLLDVGHLMVSARSLGLDFARELATLVGQADYLHLSDNDGRSDQNRPLDRNGELWRQLQHCDLRGKVMTLEIYADLREIEQSYLLLREAIA